MKPQSFRAALAQHPEAVEELSDDTLLRYTRGNFPKAVQWLIRYPLLLRGLADDAEREMKNQLSAKEETN